MTRPVTRPVTRNRWGWVFWALAVLALLPVLASALQLRQQISDPELQTIYGELTEAPFGFLDAWTVVTSQSSVGWSAVIGAILTAGLGFVVIGRTPGWLVVPRGRQVVTVLAIVCALWAAAAGAVTTWSELSPPTPWRAEIGAQSSWFAAGPSWVLDVVECFVAATVAGGVAVLSGWVPDRDR